jgi:hypothetical protein
LFNPEKRKKKAAQEIPGKFRDEESKSFTLVQSRKKKKRQLRKSLENSGMKNPLRRSSRITPSIYGGGGAGKSFFKG